MATFRQVKPEAIILGREINLPDVGELGIFTSETTDVMDFTDQGNWKVQMRKAGQFYASGTANEFTITTVSGILTDYVGDYVTFSTVNEEGEALWYVSWETTGSDPAVVAPDVDGITPTQIEVIITGQSTTGEIATLTSAAINLAIAADVSASVSGDVVTLLNHNSGAVTPAAYVDAVPTSISVAVATTTSGVTDTYQLKTMLGNLQLNSGSGVVEVGADPSTVLGVATKQYVDAAVEASASGLDPKESCRAATTVSIDANASTTVGTFAYNRAGGVSTRGEITATLALSGTFTVDGIDLVDGDRVLVQDQNAQQVSTVICGTGGSLTDGDYFDLYAPDTANPGSPDLLFRVWYDLNGGGTATPGNGGGTLIPVSYTGADTDIAVANATVAAVNPNANFSADNASGTVATVTITNANEGWTVDITDGVDATGFTFATSVQGGGDDNGIYTVGIVTTVLTLTRAEDFDDDNEVTANAYCFVEEGSSNADKGFVLTTNDPLTVGGVNGTVQTWSIFSTTSGVTGAGSSVPFEVVVFGDTSGASLSNASNITMNAGVMTFFDTGSTNAIVTDSATATALSIEDNSGDIYFNIDALDTMLELPQNVEIGTSGGGKILDFPSGAIDEAGITFTAERTTALYMGDGTANYIEFDSITGSKEVRILQSLVAEAGVTINNGGDLTFDGATNTNQIIFGDNLEQALIIKDGDTDFMTFDSSTGTENIVFHVPITANVVCGITNVVGTTDHSMVATDCIINYNTPLDADHTITLLAPNLYTGQTIKIIRDTDGSSEFNLIIDPGAFEIDGSINDIKLKSDDDHIILTSNGVSWHII